MKEQFNNEQKLAHYITLNKLAMDKFSGSENLFEQIYLMEKSIFYKKRILAILRRMASELTR